MKKTERLKLISKIIQEKEISTQDELTSELILSGANISQSTVSRDINELNLIKIEGKVKKSKYALPSSEITELPPQLINLFKHVTISIETANNLIVVKTHAGHANSAGTAIDQMHFPQILGTIAGDDTLLIVAKSNPDADIIVKSLRTL